MNGDLKGMTVKIGPWGRGEVKTKSGVVSGSPIVEVVSTAMKTGL